MPILLVITALTVVLMMDYKLGVMDGIILLAILTITLTWIIRRNKQVAPDDPLASEINQGLEKLPKFSKARSMFYLLGGLVLLVISARMMVWGAVEIAEFFEVPDLIIGLTIIAIGTSLPELAASISAALKGEVDMMIGNILGSNLFNLLAVLAVPAILAPSLIDNDLLKRDLPILLGFTVAMLLVALPRKGSATIYRVEGVFLLTLFFGYLTLLYFNTVT